MYMCACVYVLYCCRVCEMRLTAAGCHHAHKRTTSHMSLVIYVYVCTCLVGLAHAKLLCQLRMGSSAAFIRVYIHTYIHT